MADKSSLRKYLDTKKKPTVLLGLVERSLLAAPLKDRRTDVLHPSEITKFDWCPREGWFLLKGYAAIQDKPTPRLASIFAEGHEIHRKWQKWAQDVGVLVKAELPVVFYSYRIQGNTDGLLLIEGRYYVWEIKSIGLGTLRVQRFPIFGGLGQSFRNINRPFNDHVRQAMLYAWILKRSGYPTLDAILITYECKEDQAAKEFVVQYNEEYLEVVFDKLAMLFPHHDGELVDSPPACVNDEGCPCRRFTWDS